MPYYANILFGLFGGEETRVTIEGEKAMIGVLIDRFRKDIPIMPIDSEHFRTHVNVAISNQSLGWIMILGSGVMIASPDPVIEQMKAESQKLSNQYDCIYGDQL